MKILWVSDSVWHTTGYGVTSRQILERAVADGHTVYNYAPGAMALGEAKLASGITVLSAFPGDDRWGNATLQYWLNEIQPDVVITWLDAHGLTGYGLDTFPLWIWAPIDTWPVPEPELAILGRAERVLVPSRWGQEVLAKQGIKAEYVPCGFSEHDYYIDLAGRKNWREKWGIADDTFVVGMVGLNTGSPDRKGYGYAFDVLREFKDHVPNFKAYIHTDPDANDSGAINLNELSRTLGLEDTVFFPPKIGPRGWPVRYMRDTYNGIDVLLHTSLTEGFGMPIVEAQACGKHVVVNDCTSVTEIVRNGSLCKPLGNMWINTSSRIAIPDTKWMAETLYTWYVATAFLPADINAPERVMEFEEERVYEQYWRPLFESTPKHLEIAPEGSRRLILGAGKTEREGCTHHDRELYFPHISVAHDLEVLPWPWKDNSWDYVEMSDVIEHLHASVVDVMDELWRITAPGGYLFIHTVKAGSWQEKHDPTHTRGFELHSFDYFDPETDWGGEYEYTKRKWQIVKRTIDTSGGILLIMQPRKERAETYEERLYGRDVVEAAG